MLRGRCGVKTRIGGSVLELIQGDITTLVVDAIVNAANDRLILGGGVAGAIRMRGGPAIQEACNRIGGTFVGGAVITTAGNLPAKHVIHAVGPRWGEGEEDGKLRDAILNSLKVAEKNGLKSIAFPAISTGIFGFPLERAAGVMLRAAKEHLEAGSTLERVIFCLYGPRDFEMFKRVMESIF